VAHALTAVATAPSPEGWRRWIPVASMTAVSLISYIDRNTLALLAPTILRDLRLSAEQYGYVISAFSLAYMASNPLWGHWLDRFGLRWGMAAAVMAWTVASASHALAAGFLALAVARAALGFGEGATFPGGIRAAMQTLPGSLQSRGTAIAYSGGSLGAVLTPIVITPIAARWGWRGAFWFTGLIGLVWVLAWIVVSRRADVRASPSAAIHGAMEGKPLDRRLWALVFAYACGGLPLAFVLYTAPIYLSRALGRSQLEIGHVLWIPPLGWEAGYLFWSWMIDHLAHARGRSVGVYARVMGVAALLSLPLVLTPRLPSLALVMVELFVAMFAAAAFVMGALAYATFAFTTARAGLLAGIGAGSWSAVVAVMMPVFGRLLDQQRYEEAFALAAAFPVAGFLGWLAFAHGGHKVSATPSRG
jgi:MFS transporter, ACS family, aldohexuronate transporter